VSHPEQIPSPSLTSSFPFLHSCAWVQPMGEQDSGLSGEREALREGEEIVTKGEQVAITFLQELVGIWWADPSQWSPWGSRSVLFLLRGFLQGDPGLEGAPEVTESGEGGPSELLCECAIMFFKCK